VTGLEEELYIARETGIRGFALCTESNNSTQTYCTLQQQKNGNWWKVNRWTRAREQNSRLQRRLLWNNIM